ncbi:sensor histidine kinase [Scatolibacter rhodanostii]|uniref:sensor histidine kinase n=1 Tax=Scatolibacter rhodanostii TaxID=2014781 RepID=UPI000C078D17|nr:HAMP domain-containing sensor histidine kinase [Scatolibacter rhodanostii]
MKLRFWQKTYLLTLLLFVLFFCGGVFLMAFSNQQKFISKEKESALSQQAYRVDSIKNDMGQIQAGRMVTLADVFTTYSDYYQQEDTLTEFRSLDDEGNTLVLASSIPQELTAKFDAVVQNQLSPTQDSGNVLLTENGYFFCISSPLDDSHYFITVIDFSPLFAELRSQRVFYTLLCSCISVLLAVVLFFVLRRISYPLQRLSATADKIAGGALSVRAEVKGHDEISELASSFNNMAESVVSKMEALEIAAEQKERISDNLSHEIRTPLTAIQGYAEYMILANITEEEREKALGYIIEESQRLQKISDRMLKLSVMRREEVELLPLSIVPIFEHVALTISAKAAKQKLRFQIERVPDITINGDEILLESLFTNIADNALKACRNTDDFVSISFRVLPEELCVVIQDTGGGMTEEEVKKLGEPFYRPDKARSRKAGGAGLGITLCCQIALLHKAKLVYFSKLDVGTEVHISFPLIEPLPLTREMEVIS